MPTASATMQAFARAEATLREEIAEAEVALERAQEKRATAAARLEELLRVRAVIVGQPEAEAPAEPKAKQAAEPKMGTSVARAPRAAGALPAAGTATRAILDAVLAGARRYQDIREQTGFDSNRITGILPGLVKRGLVLRAGTDDYAPADAAG